MAVWLTPLARTVMVEHCKVTYPNEGCGILVGKREGREWFVANSVPVPNRAEERQRDRFEISPKDYLRVEKEARQQGWEIIGFFHSHPDVAPYPSATDAQYAWSQLLYIIVGVFGGQKVRVRAHLFENQRFHELPVYVLLHGTVPNADNLLNAELPILDLTDEVEPFITLRVKEQLQNLPTHQCLLVRFRYEPTLSRLPDALVAAGHTLLFVRWNEEGAWEVLVRAKGENKTDKTGGDG